MRKSFSELEFRRLKRLKKQYEAKGYAVEVEPTSTPMPRALERLRPDMIAQKGDEVLVFEVKSKATIRQSKHIEELAKQVNEIPGWQFVLVLTNPKEDSEETSFSSIHLRLNEAKELALKDYEEASSLLLWTVVEGVLRHLAQANSIALRKESPRLLVKKLFSDGLLSEREFSALEKLAQRRNLIAHGAERKSISQKTLSREFKIVESLLSREEFVD